MCAKYGRSRMNDAHTISLADSVSCPAKVVQSTTIFLKKKAFFYTTFMLAYDWLTCESAHEEPSLNIEQSV